MKRKLCLVVMVLAAVVALIAVGAPVAAASVHFAVNIAPGVSATPLDGRLLVIVTDSYDGVYEPRLQASDGWVAWGPPFWGMNVNGMRPGVPVAFGGPGVVGASLASLDDLPPGKYYVQALLNVYTTCRRSDGSVVKVHMPAGEGQNPFLTPGNLVSTPVKLNLNPAADKTFALRLDQVLPPLEMVPPCGTPQQGNPIDTAHVRHIKIKSKLLSSFWGRPMYLGATILLPEGYDDPANRGVRYPVEYEQGHFTTEAPWGFTETLDDEAGFSQWWVSDAAPRVIYVTFRHECPFYDDSYAVNSANIGPYGDAITKELMPAIDRSFRTIDARWARVTGGGSTGGWEAAAQMIFYPRLYSGAFVFWPDPMDFHGLELVNIYDDPSAFYSDYPENLLAIPSFRDNLTGETYFTAEQENRWELALGTRGRSGLGQWDIWQAVFGPQGRGGYPAAIWDKETGVIDHGVARAWKPKDLDLYLKRHWDAVGPLVAGRMFFWCGTMDNFFLDNPTRIFEAQTAILTDPAADFSFEWGEGEGHGWLPMSPPDLVTQMADYMAARAPDGVEVSGWYGQ
jgi:hypothetical protein